MQTWKNLALPSALVLVAIACQPDDSGFTSGGSQVGPTTWDTSSWGEDTADTGDTGADDTGADDTGADDTGADDTVDTDTGPDITGTGYDVGDVAYDLTAEDQRGDDWSLYEQYGDVVVLGFGNWNDVGFQTTSESFAELESEFSSQGVTFALILERDINESFPDEDDTSAWAGTYSVSTVLAGDSDIQTDWAITESAKVYIINEEMEIVWVNTGPGYASEIENQLDDLLY